MEGGTPTDAGRPERSQYSSLLNGLIRRDQVRQLFGQAQTGLIPAHLSALVLAIALWPVVPESYLVAWFGAYSILQIPRYVMAVRFRLEEPPDAALESRGRMFCLFTLLSAVVWGTGGLALFPTGSVQHQFMLALFMAGISAAGAVVYSPVKSCWLPTIVLTLAPIGGRFIYEGDPINWIIGLMILVYMIVLILTASYMYSLNGASYRLNHEKTDLIESLRERTERADELNRRLSEEIEQRRLAQKELTQARQNLEERVEERTTELARAKRALELSEDQYRSLVEGSLDGIFVQKGGKIAFANQRLHEMLGYGPGELEQLDRWEIYHPEDRTIVRERELARIRNQPVPEQYEVRLRRKDGATVLAEMAAHIGLFGGEPGTHVAARDITERKEAEEEKRRLAEAVEQAAETIIITDTDETILYVNPACEATTGYSRDELVGRTPAVFRSGKHDPEFYAEIRAVVSGGESWKGRFVNRKKDGSLFEEEATISPVRDESGRIVNYVAVKRDISHEAELERQLMQAQRMEAVGRLAGGISHDFKNLLMVTLGHVDLLLMDKKADHQDYGDLIAIRGLIEEGADLAKRILTFSRKTQTVLKPLDLNSRILRVRDLLQRTFPEAVTVRVELDETKTMILGDAGQIEQALLNLAVNAKDAMPEGGALTFKTEICRIDEAWSQTHLKPTPGDYVKLSVIDTGHGMEPEVLDHIFEPFFSTKSSGHGTGLGLAMVFGIVETHRGHITCSSSIDEGASFELYFPVAVRR